MAKEEVLEFPGVVTELLPNATFRVKLENEHEIIAHTAGRSACSTAHVRQIHQLASGLGAGEGAGVVVMAQVYRAPPTRDS